MAHLIAGNGRFDFDIVGESFHQDNLNELAGPKCEEGCDLDCLAALIFDDGNPHDSQAVAVAIVKRDATVKLVGHLSRSNARYFRKCVAEGGRYDPNGMLVRAKIIGGWQDEAGDEGMYGVKLDLMLPITFRTAKAWENWEERLLP